MTVLGIDPGTTESAYCLWDGERVIEADILPNESLLKLLPMFVSDSPTVAIEKICSYGCSVGEKERKPAQRSLR